MANKILIIGDSGSGKSTSTRNLDPSTTFYINCIGKPLPFRGWKKKYETYDATTKKGNLLESHDANQVNNALKHVAANLPHIKTIIVDDAQYIMSYEFMDRAKEKGFDKFTEIAQNMFNVLRTPDTLRTDLTVVYLAHSEDVSANGYIRTKMKTIGKMLDDKITVEGLFSIVLIAYPVKQSDKTMEYVFVTQSNGATTAKAPMGMFAEIAIPNDLNEVLTTINEYNEGE